ncbi:MAG: hypothetical protein RI894_2471 [Bacteroidota bacterium]|jgi:hypothetical protein
MQRIIGEYTVNFSSNELQNAWSGAVKLTENLNLKH